MDSHRLVLRAGAGAILAALLLRLLCALSGEGTLPPELVSFLFFMETGRRATFSAQPEETRPSTVATQPKPALPAFSAQDAQRVTVRSGWGYEADVEALLRQPLRWELASTAPTVLILHSHATESYENTEGYKESGNYRTLDTDYNMVSIGRRVKELLEAEGICVIHDEALHDYPSYNGSYENSRATLQRQLSQNPQLLLVLDLHRDALEDSQGNQAGPTITAQGQAAARLMLVVGSDFGGLEHPHWEENLALAVKLQATLEAMHPGICRDISFRSQRFNQDLSPGALLVEVGAAGNTRQEALAAAECLAQAIVALSRGAES